MIAEIAFDAQLPDFFLGSRRALLEHQPPMRTTPAIKWPPRFWAAAVCLLCLASAQAAEPTVRDTHDGIIARMLGSLSQVFTINGKRLVTQSCDLEARTRAEFVVEK